jgi:Restriction endonuclease S subunits
MNIWIEADLSELISKVESGSRPKGGVSINSGEIPSLGGENILQRGGITLEDLKRIPFEFYRTMTKGVLTENDVLINKDGANTGKVGMYRNFNFSIATINEHLFLLRGHKDKITQEYLYYYLFSEFGQYYIKTKITGSAQPGLNSTFINSFPIKLPINLDEQNKITSILSTIDKAIEQSEALIVKYQRIKTGLMQDLLTRGIDENGNIRSEETHGFKDSPLGRTPKDWEVFRLDDLLIQKQYGVSVSLNDGEGIPVLRMNNLNDGEVDFSDLKYSNSEVAKTIFLKPLDVLFNRTNSAEYVGRTGIFRGHESKVSFASYLVRLVPKTSKLLPEYLNLWLNSPGTQIAVKRIGTVGVQQVNVNPTNLGTLYFALPKKTQEQQQIIDAIGVQNQKIRSEQWYLNKLQKIKTRLNAGFINRQGSSQPFD